MTAKPEIFRAADELVTLALAVRHDWDEMWITSALTQANLAGMTWPQILTALTRLMADPKGQPRDLVSDYRQTRAIPGPSVAAEGAARVREALRSTP